MAGQASLDWLSANRQRDLRMNAFPTLAFSFNFISQMQENGLKPQEEIWNFLHFFF